MKAPGEASRHRRPSVYFILLLSYISVLLLTLSSSIIYYLQIDKQISARTEISRQLLLTQLQTSVEGDLAGAKKLVQEVAFDKNIHQYAKGRPGFTSKELQSMLASRLYQKDIVYDYLSISEKRIRSSLPRSKYPPGSSTTSCTPLRT